MEDCDVFFDGGPKWRPEFAIRLADRLDVKEQISVASRDLQNALQPAPPQWFGKRLPVLWTLFMATREVDPRALTVWMTEMASLLGDLPHDIVAHSIDEAIRTSGHGFIPSVGEIRKIADPLVAERHLHIERLGRILELTEQQGK